MTEPNHFRRIMVLWVALSVIATPIVVLVAAPGLPPGKSTTEASSQVADNTVLLGIATPIAALVLVYFAYTLIVFRHREAGPDDGVAIRGNNRVVVTWLVVTSVIVVFAAAYGTARLFAGTGSGGGQGSDPIAKPSGGPQLQVQVIGQQWNWT
jgi:heme/copper-type cytochrome/quinol oxidase subunit 2